MTDFPLTSKPKNARLGRYLLRYLVAQGGMASVYLAQLPGPHGFEKWVAIKIIHPHLARNKRFVRMFLNEATVAGRINHPNVCSVIDFGIDEERRLPYLVMEYLHGETFANTLRRLRKDGLHSPLRAAARVVADAARGLHAAHELKRPDGESLGIVHRDISPQNILVLYCGVAKVLDFGVARLRDQSSGTKSNELRGTLGYMSPEQFRAEELDRRSDVWSLGVVLWEATVGRRLFQHRDQGALIYSLLEQPIPLPSQELEGYPEELEQIVLCTLERDPSRRYPTAAALASDLERFLYQGEEIVGPDQVGELMSRVFADRLASRNALLRSQTLPVNGVPELDLGREETREIPVPSDLTEPLGQKERKRGLARRLALAGAAVLAALLIAVAFGSSVLVDTGGGVSPRADAAAARSSAQALPEEAGLDPAEGPGSELGSRRTARAEVTAPGPVKIASQAPAELAGVAPRPAAKTGPAPAGDTPPGGKAPRSAEERAKTSKGLADRDPPGKLSLLAIPPAEVSIGSRRIGRTPLFNLKLQPGTHHLTLRPLGGGASKTIVVRIASGKTVRTAVRF